MTRICLVTEELAGIARSGGIGAAFRELALFLSNNGFQVDILYHSTEGIPEETFRDAKKLYRQNGVKLFGLDLKKYVDSEPTPRAVSYAVYKTLIQSGVNYDFIHFHDYKGMAFYSLSAKRQLLAFKHTQIVVQIHGPTRWTIDANATFFTHEEQLHIDYLERKSMEWADQLVAPSEYIAKWVLNKFFKNRDKKIKVIKNLCRFLVAESRIVNGSNAKDESSDNKVEEIIVFGRHEDRKGIAIACDALNKLAHMIERNRIRVSFLGAPGYLSAQPSAIYFIEKFRNWNFSVNFHFGLDRSEAAHYLSAANNALVLIPSPVENSPYTVLEALVLNKPVLCSVEGGGIELIHPDDRHLASCSMTVDELAAAIEKIIQTGLKNIRIAESPENIEQSWLSFHKNSTRRVQELGGKVTRDPLVTIGITHFERPAKLIDAFLSILRQDYSNFEIVVVDDGSSSAETLCSLEYIEKLVIRTGSRFIRQTNGYLGAARNAVLRCAKGEYVLFLDDDDIAMTHMVSTLVQCATATKADVVTCLNVFMPETLRSQVIGGEDLDLKVCYFPLGGPLSLAAVSNVFGSATSLMKRSMIEKIGGYTELKNVGHEDYELYIRLVQAGASLDICPEPLFFYEVGRPSMISRTSMSRNFRRCFDALGFDKFEDEWIDFINLGVGQKIQTQAYNFAWWVNSQTPTAAKRHALMQHEGGLEDYLRIAAEIAAEEECGWLAAAFSNGLQFKLAQDDQRKSTEVTYIPLVPRGVHLSHAHPEELDRDLIEIRTDIALGRVDKAVERFISYCEISKDLDPQAELVLSELANGGLGELRPDIIVRLSSVLCNCNVSAESSGAYAPILTILAMAGQQRIVATILEELVLRDGEEYITNYPDVAQGVGDEFTPLWHFVIHGEDEGRTGFEKSRGALEVLGRIWKQSLHLRALPAVIESLKGTTTVLNSNEGGLNR